ncbi:MAG: hypothetical protein VX656_01215, partial [Candidatus Latescibacterota bacterium]|nr:hypothetical protein [Candidatus Latescibacterota bacterium]
MFIELTLDWLRRPAVDCRFEDHLVARVFQLRPEEPHVHRLAGADQAVLEAMQDLDVLVGDRHRGIHL